MTLVILVAFATSVVTSALMVWLFAPQSKSTDFSMFVVDSTNPNMPFTMRDESTAGSTELTVSHPCPCGYNAKSERGLKIHQTKMHS